MTAEELNGVGVGKGLAEGAAAGRLSSASNRAQAAKNAGRAAAVRPSAAARTMKRRRSIP